jgi:hypothetical protein
MMKHEPDYTPVPIAMIVFVTAVIFGVIGIALGLFSGGGSECPGLITGGAVLISGGIIAIAITSGRKKG